MGESRVLVSAMQIYLLLLTTKPLYTVLRWVGVLLGVKMIRAAVKLIKQIKVKSRTKKRQKKKQEKIKGCVLSGASLTRWITSAFLIFKMQQDKVTY